MSTYVQKALEITTKRKWIFVKCVRPGGNWAARILVGHARVCSLCCSVRKQSLVCFSVSLSLLRRTHLPWEGCFLPLGPFLAVVAVVNTEIDLSFSRSILFSLLPLLFAVASSLLLDFCLSSSQEGKRKEERKFQLPPFS